MAVEVANGAWKMVCLFVRIVEVMSRERNNQDSMGVETYTKINAFAGP